MAHPRSRGVATPGVDVSGKVGRGVSSSNLEKYAMRGSFRHVSYNLISERLINTTGQAARHEQRTAHGPDTRQCRSGSTGRKWQDRKKLESSVLSNEPDSWPHSPYSNSAQSTTNGQEPASRRKPAKCSPPHTDTHSESCNSCSWQLVRGGEALPNTGSRLAQEVRCRNVRVELHGLPVLNMRRVPILILERGRRFAILDRASSLARGESP